MVRAFEPEGGSRLGVMGTGAIGIESAERRGGWRLMAVLLMVAFSFQSYVAQTHIHQSASTAAAATVQHRGHNSPAENSPFDCPICQAVSHVGSFFVPDVVMPFLAAQFVETANPQFYRADRGTAVHRNWQSRAPPSP